MLLHNKLLTCNAYANKCRLTLPYVYYLLLLLVLYIVQPTIAFHIATIARIARFPSFTIERYNSTNFYKEGTFSSKYEDSITKSDADLLTDVNT